MSAWISAAFSLCTTAALMPVARRLALHLGIVDSPASGKVHTLTTPYLGGPAIAIVLFMVSWMLPGWTPEVLVLLACALAVCAIGLFDDVRTLAPLPRVAVEVAAAAVVLWSGPTIQLREGSGYAVLTVAWVVLLTNSFNLLDNMDGCAGVVALVTAAGIGVDASLQGQDMVGSLALATAASCGGFLIFNWPPASLFMGDAGSLFLGFMLAVMALNVHASSRGGDDLALIVVALPVLFDTSLVVISRALARRPILTRGTDHTSHRLLRLGLPISGVAAALGVGAAVCSVLGAAVGRGVIPFAVVAVPLTVGACASLTFLLQVRSYD